MALSLWKHKIDRFCRVSARASQCRKLVDSWLILALVPIVKTKTMKSVWYLIDSNYLVVVFFCSCAKCLLALLPCSVFVPLDLFSLIVFSITINWSHLINYSDGRRKLQQFNSRDASSLFSYFKELHCLLYVLMFLSLCNDHATVVTKWSDMNKCIWQPCRPILPITCDSFPECFSSLLNVSTLFFN